MEGVARVRRRAGAADAVPRPVQPAVAGSALALLAAGAIGLSIRFGIRHGALFLVGGALGFVLHQSAFGFTTAFRVFAAEGDGRGVRAQLVMLALATVAFAPILASGEVFGQTVGGAVAPASLSVLVGATLFAVGMQLGGG
jgi:uncharacterized membrane protein YedE/YeeE